MKIQLNGEIREVSAHTISELLNEIEAPVQGVAVALNSHVVRRAEHATTHLQDNDKVEVIRAVQGG